MTKNTIKVFGHRCLMDGTIESKIFKTIAQYKRWVGSLPGSVQGMSFTRCSEVVYRYGYNKGKRRSFNHSFTAFDYYSWNNWYSICRGIKVKND